jgi:hypothetical protein
MRKILILGFAAILAVLTLGLSTGSANAATQTGTATFTAIQPAQDFGQFENVWTHVYTVNVYDDGSFSGTGLINGADGSTTMENVSETVTGKINVDGTINLEATRIDGVKWSLTNAITDGDFINKGTLLVPNDPGYRLDVKVSPLVHTPVATPPVALGNHGECVSSAAHAGVKGKDLAGIAKVVTKVGAYGSATCPALPGFPAA